MPFSVRFIVLCFLLPVMVLGQLAIASHNSVHVYHDQQITMHHAAGQADQDGDHDKAPGHGQDCPEYLLAKSFQIAFDPIEALQVHLDFFMTAADFSAETGLFPSRERANHPRAPPVFLI